MALGAFLTICCYNFGIFDRFAAAFSARVSGPNSTRTFRVKAYNAGGWSNWSLPSTFSTSPPTRPLKMSAPVDKSASYRLYNQNNCSAMTFQWLQASTSGMPLVAYDTLLDNTTMKSYGPGELLGYFSGLMPGTDHYVQVRAVNSFRGELMPPGEWSEPLHHSTWDNAPPYTPQPPERITVDGLSPSTTITLDFYSSARCSNVVWVDLMHCKHLDDGLGAVGQGAGHQATPSSVCG